MRYTVVKQWAVVDGHRGRVVEAFESEGEAYRAAYKKEQASQKREKVKKAVQRAAGLRAAMDPRLNDSVADIGKQGRGLLPIQ